VLKFFTRLFLCVSVLFAGAPLNLAADFIVIVKSRDIEPYDLALKSFRRTLNNKGYEPVVSEYVLPEGGREKENLLADIRRREPRLIVTLGSAATSYISKAIKNIPVTFCMVLNPLASGFIRSMNASGNNLTGASLDIPISAQFETLKAVLPSLKRIGVLYNPQETEVIVQQARRTAKEMDLELVAIAVASEDKVPDALRSLNKNVDAIWSVADGTVFSSGSQEFILYTLQNKIPFMGLSPAFAKAGALLALDADYQEIGSQCGGLAAKILGGESPSSLPTTIPQKSTLYVNLKTAETLGLKIPPERLKGAVLIPSEREAIIFGK
jgi:putative tryptophan/tyrosine transport system substrate-binding protein